MSPTTVATRLAVSGTVAAVMLTTTTGVAAARPGHGDVECTTTLANTIIRGDIKVADDAECILKNVRVQGNINVPGSSRLTVRNSRIEGVASQYPAVVLLQGSVVGGNADLGSSAGVRNSVIRGDLSFIGPTITVCDSRVNTLSISQALVARLGDGPSCGGNLIHRDMALSSIRGLYLSGNLVQGNVTAADLRYVIGTGNRFLGQVPPELAHVAG